MAGTPTGVKMGDVLELSAFADGRLRHVLLQVGRRVKSPQAVGWYRVAVLSGASASPFELGKSLSLEDRQVLFVLDYPVLARLRKGRVRRLLAAPRLRLSGNLATGETWDDDVIVKAVHRCWRGGDDYDGLLN